MVGGDDGGVVFAEGFGGNGHGLHIFKIVVAHFVHLREVRVVVFDLRAALLEQLHNFEGRGLAEVVDVFFIGDTEDQQFRAVEAFLVAVQGFGDGIDDVIGHGSIDFAGQLDETSGEIVFAGFPGKIIRIDGNAVAAQTRTGIKRHEAERLGGGGVDDFPDVDVHARSQKFEFVDEGDVDAAKNIFEQLGHFRGARGADGNDFGDHLGVDGESGAAAGRIDAADDFGNLRQAILLVAGIFAFRGKGQEKVGGNIFAFDAGGDGAAQTAFFENREDQFFGGAGISGGFENDELAALQIGLNRDGGLFDVAEVRFAAFVERSRNTNEDGVGFLELGKIGGGAEVAAVDELLNFGLLDVLDVGFAGVEHGNFGGIGVKAGDFVAGFCEAQRQGQAHVTATDDRHF